MAYPSTLNSRLNASVEYMAQEPRLNFPSFLHSLFDAAIPTPLSPTPQGPKLLAGSGESLATGPWPTGLNLGRPWSLRHLGAATLLHGSSTTWGAPSKLSIWSDRATEATAEAC